jgi:hypothetical protein
VEEEQCRISKRSPAVLRSKASAKNDNFRQRKRVQMCRLVTEANIFKRISWDLQGKEQYCLGSLTKTLQMVGRVLEKNSQDSEADIEQDI